jgi:hypothetical protein
MNRRSNRIHLSQIISSHLSSLNSHKALLEQEVEEASSSLLLWCAFSLIFTSEVGSLSLVRNYLPLVSFKPLLNWKLIEKEFAELIFFLLHFLQYMIFPQIKLLEVALL